MLSLLDNFGLLSRVSSLYKAYYMHKAEFKQTLFKLLKECEFRFLTLTLACFLTVYAITDYSEDEALYAEKFHIINQFHKLLI